MRVLPHVGTLSLLESNYMNQPFYLLQPARLKRKQNTLVLEQYGSADHRPAVEVAAEFQQDWPLYEQDSWWSGSPKRVPIKRISSIHAYAPIEINSSLLEFLSAEQIPLHIYNYYGGWSGSYLSRPVYPNGRLLKEQVRLQDEPLRQTRLAAEILRAGLHHMRRNLRYYIQRGYLQAQHLENWDRIAQGFGRPQNLDECLGQEGTMRRLYYEAVDELIAEPFKLQGREFHPPSNPGNAVVSFVNSLVYTTIISECYRTQLDSSIGILHSEGRHRHPLAWDLAEIFKPLFSESLLLTLTRKKQLTLDDFDQSMNYCLLNDQGRNKVLRAWESKLRSTIEHPRLKRKVSYRQLMRFECYKLIRHFLEREPYEAFTIHW